MVCKEINLSLLKHINLSKKVAYEKPQVAKTQNP